MRAVIEGEIDDRAGLLCRGHRVGSGFVRSRWRDGVRGSRFRGRRRSGRSSLVRSRGRRAGIRAQRQRLHCEFVAGLAGMSRDDGHSPGTAGRQGGGHPLEPLGRGRDHLIAEPDVEPDPEGRFERRGEGLAGRGLQRVGLTLAEVDGARHVSAHRPWVETYVDVGEIGTGQREIVDRLGPDHPDGVLGPGEVDFQGLASGDDGEGLVVGPVEQRHLHQPLAYEDALHHDTVADGHRTPGHRDSVFVDYGDDQVEDACACRALDYVGDNVVVSVAVEVAPGDPVLQRVDVGRGPSVGHGR